MAGTLLTCESANLYCGAEPGTQGVGSDSLHLEIVELKLPAMNEANVDHRGGGAPIAIEIETIFNKLECTFQLLGWDAQVAALIGQWQQNVTTTGASITGAGANMFFAYGVLRDQMTGLSSQAAAYMQGRLGLADPQMFRRGDSQHWNYGIKGITHYELSVSGEPLYQWDFFSNILLVGGQQVNADVNLNLNIPTVTPTWLLGSTVGTTVSGPPVG
jgi:phage tail tube protein FII